jgi:hypothetical protein
MKSSIAMNSSRVSREYLIIISGIKEGTWHI